MYCRHRDVWAVGVQMRGHPRGEVEASQKTGLQSILHSLAHGAVALVGMCGCVVAELEIFLGLKSRHKLQLFLLESWNV